MECGNNQDVCRCLRIKIVKGENIFVAIEDICRNYTFNDFAEDALWI
jgi:hypothetical protein